MINGRPVVLVDCDDVVGRFNHGICKLIFERTGVQYTEEDIRTWDIFQTISHPEHPDLEDHCYAIANSPGWCLDIEPFPGAQEGIAKLREVSEVFFVTSPFKGITWEGERRAWIEKHFGVDKKHVIQAHAKFLVRGEFLVDDKPDNIRKWQNYNPDDVAMLWDRPHNRDADDLYRVHSWQAVLEDIY
jgi:5'(3')-deoxyribonucleotidase